MQTIHETRRENLALAIAAYFPNARQLALKIGVSPNSISRIFNENPDNRRNVGDDMARAIEKEAGLPVGWMDAHHKNDDAALLAGGSDFYDAELADVMGGISDSGLEKAITAISGKLPPKDAMKLAMILLSRVDSEL